MIKIILVLFIELFSKFERPDYFVFQVQKITYVVGKDKAVGTLFPGAIIDGKPVCYPYLFIFKLGINAVFCGYFTLNFQAKSAQIVINYPHAAPQFWSVCAFLLNEPYFVIPRFD